MPDPFSTALAVLHKAAGSVAAIFIPAAGGPPIPIRVIRDQGSGDAGSGFGRAVVDTNAVVIQRVDVERPLAGDLVMIGDETLRLQGGPVLDTEGTSWSCPAVLA